MASPRPQDMSDYDDDVLEEQDQEFYSFAELRSSQRLRVPGAASASADAPDNNNGQEQQPQDAAGGNMDPFEEISYATRIADVAAWQTLAFLTEEAAFANTEIVKIVLDVRRPKDRICRGVKPNEVLPLAAGVLDELVLDECDDELGAPYFLQSRKHTWHFPFAKKHLMSMLSSANPFAHHEFNKVQYTSDKRDFCLLTLTRYMDHGGIVCLEMWPSDTLSGERMAGYAALIQQCVSRDLGEFCFHPMSPDQEKKCIPAIKALGMRVVTSGELFGMVKFQPLTLGRAVGRIRFVTASQLERTGNRALIIKPWDILVMDQIANDLPMCAGLITSVVQPPLCHTALLCQNRGTPNMAVVGVFDTNLDEESIRRHGKLRSLDKCWVELVVTQQAYEIKEVSKDFAVAEFLEKAERNARAPGSISIDRNVDFDVIVSVKEKMPSEAKHALGAKAAQFCELSAHKWDRRQKRYQQDGEGVVIPFYYYHKFMEAIDAPSFIKRALAAAKSQVEDPDMFASTYLRVGLDDDSDEEGDQGDRLAEISLSRSALASSLVFGKGSMDTPMAQTVDAICHELCDTIIGSDNAVLDTLCNEILPVFDRWEKEGLLSQGAIFRSSTNCEDLPGFNGAGLYESLPISADKTRDRSAIKDVVKRVFASMWKPRGFSERQIYGISQEQAAMAILVQPYACDIHANGVVVSLIPYKKGWSGCFINVQHGDAKVTDAGNGAPEQIAVYDENGGYAEIVARSSLNGGAPVISAKEARRIFTLVMDLHKKYGAGKAGQKHNAVDVEFVIVGEKRRILLLQCRPCTYNMGFPQIPKNQDGVSKCGVLDNDLFPLFRLMVAICCRSSRYTLSVPVRRGMRGYLTMLSGVNELGDAPKSVCRVGRWIGGRGVA